MQFVRGRIDTAETTEGMIPSEKIVEQKSNFSQEFNTDFPEMDSSSHNESFDENEDLRHNFDKVTEEDEKLITMASSMQAKEFRKIEEKVWSNKDLLENSSSFPVTSADTKSNKIDNDGAFISDLDPKIISITGNDGTVINQQSAQTRLGTGTEELIIGGTTVTQSIHEDACLFGAATLCDSKTTSDHIPYSGNISHRSDSSATSTHSFAFPILQSEWNSSPVRMAKADRKQLRKHRWRTALFCCRF